MWNYLYETISLHFVSTNKMGIIVRTKDQSHNQHKRYVKHEGPNDNGLLSVLSEFLLLSGPRFLST